MKTVEDAVDCAIHYARIGEVYRAMMVIEVSLGVNAPPGDKTAAEQLRNFRWKFKDENWDGKRVRPEEFLPSYAEVLLERAGIKPRTPCAA